jgi:thiol-disulfide isomerase/thioredoxin
MKHTAFATALMLALFGCGSQPHSKPNSRVTIAPGFELENIAGGTTNSTALKGKVVVIDFWATWCEPCLSEIPKFNRITDEYAGKDVEIIGVAVESKKEDIKPKAKATGMKYTVLVGDDHVVDGFGGIMGWPTTFVLTKEFQVHSRYIGALADKEERIKKDIDELLSQ